MKKILFIIIFILCTLKCNYSVSQYGGSGTETINAQVFLADGSPANNAVVELIDNIGWIDSIVVGSSPVVKRFYTDKKGFVSFSLEEDKSLYNLQVAHQEGGTFLSLKSMEAETLKLQIRPYKTLKGSFNDSSSANPKKIFLSGTSYSAEVTDNLSFFFPSVATGSYALLCKNSSNNIWLVNTFSLDGEERDYSMEKLSGKIDRLLIDNFEAGIGPTSLGKIFSSIWWYVLSDSLYFYWDNEKNRWERGKSSVIGNSPIWFDSVKYEANNKAFTYSTVLDPISHYSNALIGIATKQLTGNGIDLSTVNRFGLKAWGKGNIRVRFESKNLEENGSVLSYYTYIIKLQSTPVNYLIPVDSLKIIEKGPNPANFPWEKESQNIIRIEFEFSPSDNPKGDTLTLYLDDFFLEGISLSKLFSDIKNVGLTKGKNYDK